MGTLTSLAEEVLVYARQIDEYHASKGLPSPTFDHDTLDDLPPDIAVACDHLVDTTQTLKQLAQGGVNRTIDIVFSWTAMLSLLAIYTFKIADAVPLNGSTTYATIAEKTSLPESIVRRFLRPAMSSHIFTSSEPGTVSHTASSRLFVTLPGFSDAIGLQVAELAPVAAKTVDAVRDFGDSGEPNETAFALQHGMPIFKFLRENPENGKRFGAAMGFYTRGRNYSLKHVIQGYDWAAIDHPGSIVVDVGGGHGSVSQELARSTTNIKFIVQDLPGPVEQARKELPREMKGRIEFQEHDFFTEQTVQDADVHLMRWILHNWSDTNCVKILRALVPALEKKKDARIVLLEYVLSEEPEMRLSERMCINTDMIMLSVFNGTERTAREFKDLLKQADERLTVVAVTKPPGSAMSVVEVALRAD
ncbi:MAG: hypothetical protein Q9182_000923 [Xanthomendoza sp. 2 TL-2023]